MGWKDDLLWAMTLECDVAKHLFAKLPREDWEATLAYRPHPDQRSTRELLQYLSIFGTVGCHACLDGNWDAWPALEARAKALDVAGFPAAMDRQKKEIAELLGPVGEAELSGRRVKNAPGEEMPLGRALLDMPVRWLTGYRMQLFLYARALGVKLGTPDCWYGVSMDAPGGG